MLLTNLLPVHVLTKLRHDKRGIKEFKDKISDVTILFADIKGFTEYSSERAPEEVVRMLRNLFTEFDKLCVQHKLYKVYTIGGKLLCS